MTEYCECELRCPEDTTWCCGCGKQIELRALLFGDYAEVVAQDTGRTPCRECKRVSGHKMDCTRGRTYG